MKRALLAVCGVLLSGSALAHGGGHFAPHTSLDAQHSIRSLFTRPDDFITPPEAHGRPSDFITPPEAHSRPSDFITPPEAHSRPSDFITPPEAHLVGQDSAYGSLVKPAWKE